MSGLHTGVGRELIRINGPSKVGACGAAAFGAFVVALADLMSTIDDTSKSLVLKLSTVLVQWMFVPISVRGIGAIVVLMAIAVGVCWVTPPRSLGDAFARGLAVFALLTVVPGHPGSTPSPTVANGEMIVNSAFAQENNIELAVATVLPGANAVEVQGDFPISSCKPSVSGFLGLGSFINNTINMCPVPDKLSAGDRVKILNVWETQICRYRYARIEYLQGGQIKTGWTIAGQGDGDAKWKDIRPDNQGALFPDE